MATVVKTAAFAAFFRMIWYCFPAIQDSWLLILQTITVATLVLANVTAVFQSKVKRMLAYSSVGHAGYILLALTTGGAASAGTILYYLAAYSAATLCAFAVLNRLEQGSNFSEDSFNGLFKKSPFIAVAMTVALLSMAGIPPLAGFFGKYLVFVQALKNGYVGLVIVAVFTSLVGVYYYFRVIIAMYFKAAASEEVSVSFSLKLLLSLLVLILFVMGILPDLFPAL